MVISEMATLKCAREELRTWGGWIALAFGLAAGVAGWHWSGSVLSGLQPVVTVIESADVIVTPADVPSQDLRIVLRSPVTNNCIRVSQQLLYRAEPDGVGGVVRNYYPLGSGVNGRGFGNNAENGAAVPGMGVPGGEFVLTVSLPAHLRPGEYWLVQRSLYTCSWLAGLMSRQIPYESPPVRVVVP